MSERKRNKFVVSKALINFVFAAVLTAAATQLAHTADSMTHFLKLLMTNDLNDTHDTS
jgi:hypothetical protein